MKKRSLFAAVAMLIVSALVLTSATYAWFAAGGDATISAFTGATVEAGTGVQLKSTASGAVWANTLTSADFTGQNDHLVATTTNGTYQPVSSQNGESFLAYNISTQNKFHALTLSNTWYDVYYFYVGTINEGDNVEATLTVSGDAAAAARVAVTVGSDEPVLYSAQQETGWLPVTTAVTTDTVVDTNNNKIIDLGDGTGVAYTNFPNDGSTTVPVSTNYTTASKTFTITAPGQVDAASNTLVKVVVWLEGNDSDCTAYNVGAKETGITTAWSFHAVTPTTPNP